MNVEILFMIVLICVAMAAFVRELFPIEVTSMGLLAVLVVTGILDVQEALSGFSSTAVVAIGSLFVLSHALTKTGLLEWIADRVGDRARGRSWLMIVLLLIAVSVGSGILNNTAIVALSIPLVLKLCRRLELSPSKVLIPLSYASILGGTLTLIGTSTNLLVNSVIVESDQPPLRMFELTILGIPLAVAGLLYIILTARRFLPDGADSKELTEKYHVSEFLAELRLEEGCRLIGHSPAEEHLGEKFSVTVLKVIRGEKETHLRDADSILLQAGDLLVVQGEMEDILRLQRDRQLTLLPDVELHDEELVTGGQTLLEAWVAPGSRMIDRTLKQLEFHQRYGGFVLAVSRVKTTLRKRLADISLKFADSLLVLLPRDRIAALEATRDLVVLREREISLKKARLWWMPLVVLPLAVLAAATGLMDIAAATLVGAVIVLMLRVVTPPEAYRSIDWSVIFMIAAFVPVGHAFQVTGTADFLAQYILHASGWAPPHIAPYIVLAMIYLVTAVLTQIASNNAAAVVVAPIAISLGPALGLDPRPFVIAVCFAASAAYMTPMGYQTNLMVHAAGQYRFMDYFRYGTPLTLLIWILSTVLIPIIWPFTKIVPAP